MRAVRQARVPYGRTGTCWRFLVLVDQTAPPVKYVVPIERPIAPVDRTKAPVDKNQTESKIRHHLKPAIN